MDKILSLSNLAGIEPFSSRFARLGNLYLLFHLDSSTASRPNPNPDTDNPAAADTNFPLRLDGMLFIHINKGHFSFQLNTEPFTINAGDVIAIRPGTLVKFDDMHPESSMTILFISSTFIRELNINLNPDELRNIMVRPRALLKIDAPQADVIRKYFELLDSNAADNSGSVFASRIARDLVSAITYEILRLSHNKQLTENDIQADQPKDSQGRRRAYVFRFMQLLHVHYATQRTLDFYARQLCITPKYLSMITKTITGHTASEWMDHIVVQEAKNLLLYSDKSIQQIAYALNFPSQSAFGKYFKRLTGLSPSTFLKKRMGS